MKRLQPSDSESCSNKVVSSCWSMLMIGISRVVWNSFCGNNCSIESKSIGSETSGKGLSIWKGNKTDTIVEGANEH